MLSRFLVVMLLASLAQGRRECDQGVCGGDWWASFDRAGLSKCNQGCAMTGMCLV